MPISQPKSGPAPLLVRGISVAALLVLWAAASYVLAQPDTLPSPLRVLNLASREWASGELSTHLLATLLRVLAAFAVAMAVGLALGIAMGRNNQLNTWFDSALVVFLNLPALVVIVLCYIWVGLSEAAAVLAVSINKIPLVTTLIREGTRALDPSLRDMAQVFQMGRSARMRHVILPQLMPHIAGAARAGIALIWKIVLVVEFLGRPNGVGFQIHLYFQLFDVAMVLVYALSFVVILLAVELLLLQPWERRASRWRRA